MSTAIPVLDLQAGPARLAPELGESFRRFGFAMIRGHEIDPALIDAGWQLSREFFAQPASDKLRYLLPDQGGARGYTPFGQESAKGADVHDLKEFWHVGRTLPAKHRLASTMPPNVWPEFPAGFREAFEALFAQFDHVGLELLRSVAIHLGISPTWFDDAASEGNSVLRLAHYPPLPADPGEALRAGPHEDINLITLLLGAEESGLELLGHDGHWHGINPPEGAMVVNIGDMLQRLCNHVLPSTTHRVRNPRGERAACSRYSMPFFVHLRSNFVIETLPHCVGTDNPDRYPVPTTADEFLQERLREIGLAGPARRAE